MPTLVWDNARHYLAIIKMHLMIRPLPGAILTIWAGEGSNQFTSFPQIAPLGNLRAGRTVEESLLGVMSGRMSTEPVLSNRKGTIGFLSAGTRPPSARRRPLRGNCRAH